MWPKERIYVCVEALKYMYPPPHRSLYCAQNKKKNCVMYIREKQLRLCTYSINNMTQRKFLYILYMYNSDIEKQKKKKKC